MAVVQLTTAVASVLLALPFAMLFVSTALFAAGVPISPLHLPLAVALAAGFAAVFVRTTVARGRLRVFLLALGVAIAALAASAMLEAMVFDTSWDGQTYHAQAITEMAEGWNPLREGVPEVQSYGSELHYFAKGPWRLAASIFAFAGNFEAGKAFGLYLMLTAYLFWVAALSTFRGIGRFWTHAASVSIAVNPVAGAQLFTYYVDGQLASLIAIVMALLVLTTRQRSRALLPVLAMAIALAMETKLNGALYVLVIAGGFCLWRLVYGGRNARALGAWLVVGAFAGAVVTGYDPYTSQFAAGTIAHGNPFHPHAHWSSIISLESEAIFEGTGRIGRLMQSLLAPSLIWSDTGAGYKLPFTISLDELRQFASPDVRFGGFGPLFSGGLLLAALTLGLMLRRRRRLLPYAALFVMAGAIALSVVTFSEAWWPRLAPQLGFAPVLIGVAGILAMRRWPYRVAPSALLVILAVNSVIVLAAHTTAAFARSAESRRQLVELRQADSAIPVASLKAFPGYRYRLERAGVAYYEVESLPCPEAEWEPLGHLELYTCGPEFR